MGMAQSPGGKRASLARGLAAREQVARLWRLLIEGNEEEAQMPVLVLWAVPTVIVIGGLGYYFLRVVH
jgi:hypothetical protein